MFRRLDFQIIFATFATVLTLAALGPFKKRVIKPPPARKMTEEEFIMEIESRGHKCCDNGFYKIGDNWVGISKTYRDYASPACIIEPRMRRHVTYEEALAIVPQRPSWGKTIKCCRRR